jgi:hypothetical protein
VVSVRVEVRSRVPGTVGAGLPDVLVELADERTTAGELIRRAVAEQVRLLAANRTGDQPTGRAALDRQYLSAAEIRAQAATGTVRLSQAATVAPDDAGTEVTRAQRAFERGVFVVFVGGHQVTRLDEEIHLRLGEPVVFLRLTALVGG